MYDKFSPVADNFIDDAEIRASMKFAADNCKNRDLIKSIIDRAGDFKGLNHREALLLLECQDEELNQKIFALAKKIKQHIYGNRIVLFAPLYLSNYCVNGCVYCPYHMKNKHICRKKLTQEEIAAEVIALQDMGHKRLAIESGERSSE